MGIKNRIGRCYELGYKFLMDHPDMLLIHGIITNPFYPHQAIPHCWLTVDEKIYDPVLDVVYYFEDYINMFKARSIMVYDIVLAKQNANLTGHYGHWYEDPDQDYMKYYNKDGKIKAIYKERT